MPGKEIKGRSPRAMYSNGKLVGGQKKLDKNQDGKISGEDFAMMKKGGKVKKGLYYYMNRAKKKGTSKPGKGTVSDKALKRSAKTAKKK